MDTLWGKYVWDCLVEMERDVAWLARAVAMNHKTLQAEVRGDRGPPGEANLAKIAEALGLEKESRAQYYAAAAADMTLRVLVKRFPSLTQGEQRWIASAEKKLGEMLFARTRRIGAIFWLPLLIHELEPLRFRSGKLVIDADKAASIHVPPRFNLPEGQPFEVPDAHRHHLPVEAVMAARIIRGEVKRDEFLASLPQRLEPGPDDHYVVLPSGDLEYVNVRPFTSVLFKGQEDQPVPAMTGGNITVAGFAWARHPGESTEYQCGYVELDTLCGYRIVYAGLSHLLVKEGDCVEAGQPIGTPEATGVAVSCHMDQLVSGPDQFGREAFHPSMFFPVTSATTVEVTPEQVAVAQFLQFEENQTPYELVLSQMLVSDGRFDIFSAIRCVHEPYVLLPSGRIQADAAIALMTLMTVPIWLWRGLKTALRLR